MLVNYKTFGELVEAINACETSESRAEILRHNYSERVRQLLKLIFNKEDWTYLHRDIPATKFQDAPYGYSETTLFMELRRLYIFHNNSAVNHKKQDEIFIAMTEALPRFEFELLQSILTGKPVNFAMTRTEVESVIGQL